MGAISMVLYSIVAYLFSFATLVYAACFVANLPLGRTIDGGPATLPMPEAIAIDVALLAVFAVQHSVMARAGFKRWWTRIVPQPIERSTYVLAASGALALLLWQWEPIAQPLIWNVRNPLAVAILHVLFATGWGVLLVASFLLDHFELFGLRQAFAHARGNSSRDAEFRTPLLYRVVRHPIYLGFLVSFWSTPRMSAGHLLFSTATTAYIFLGIFLEERDLVRKFGARYREYRREVRMVLPWPGKGDGLASASRAADR